MPAPINHSFDREKAPPPVDKSAERDAKKKEIKKIKEAAKAQQEKIEQKKATEPGFAGDSEKILDFIYRNSTYYEKSHMTYPVFRME